MIRWLTIICSALGAGAAAAVPAPRVFSADPCADQYVLALAPRASIAALSREAQGPYSRLRDRAGGLPRARATVEDALARHATVVLRTYGGEAGAFARAGLRVVTLEDASDFDGVRRETRRAAAALGGAEAGERLVAAMDARLDALARRGALDVAALYVTPGGVTAGRGTFVDALFRAAGVRNAAAEAGLSDWPPLPLEKLAETPPAFAVAGFFDPKLAAADNWSPARHPAFARALAGKPVVFLPADVLSCPAWFAVEAAERIRAGAEAAR